MLWENKNDPDTHYVNYSGLSKRIKGLHDYILKSKKIFTDDFSKESFRVSSDLVPRP